MTTEQLNERLARAKASAAREQEERFKAQLREQFGTDDLTQIKGGWEERQKLREAEDKRKREAMTEGDRLRADLEKERQARLAAEARTKDVERARLYEKQDTAVRRIASQYADDEVVPVLTLMFARHLKENVPADAAKQMTEKDVAKWFADYVRKNPKLGKTPAAAPKPPVVQKPVTTGANPNQEKPQAAGGVAGKTPRPGQPNSMTKTEYRDWLKQRGYSY